MDDVTDPHNQPQIPAQRPDVREAVIDAALSLAAEQPWRAVSLGAIAQRAGIDHAALCRVFSSKPAILCGFARLIDERMLMTRPDPADRARDRLFEMMMARFDCLRPYRLGMKALVQEVPRLNLDILVVNRTLPRTMAWLLDAAGIASGGFSGVARQKLIGLVYVKTLRTFLKDESADLTRTMAALDRSLRQFEPLLRLPGGDGTTGRSVMTSDSSQT